MRKVHSVGKNRMEELPIENEKQIIQIHDRNWIMKYHVKDRKYSLYVKNANSRLQFKKN
ncbi:hypothetical protein R4Z09_21140 [Niallia oryzisoli]|uniref:Uncharacterized protein n=1 Tax=Niallia oryzisoli TaxID=1737571 RepID=A0ABZ2C849_9BACI